MATTTTANKTDTSDRLKFIVVALGPAYYPEMQAAASLANLSQDSFKFVVDDLPIKFDEAKYQLSNGGFDLVAAVSDLHQDPNFTRQFDGEVILVTSNPDSDRETAKDYSGHPLLEQCYFYRDSFVFAKNLALVSTFVWQHLPPVEWVPSTAAGQRHVQPYLLTSFAMVGLNRVLGMPLPYHAETRGCPLDYCEEVADIDRFFAEGHGFCEDCRQFLEERRREGAVTVAQLRAVQWLLLKALGSPLKYDVFISHASEDKAAVARPLCEELTLRGVRVWLDVQTLRVGESFGSKIVKGLEVTRLAVVILSEAFFAKEWPMKELEEILDLEKQSKINVFPILHNIGPEAVERRSPHLAELLAARSSSGWSSLADEIERVLTL